LLRITYNKGRYLMHKKKPLVLLATLISTALLTACGGGGGGDDGGSPPQVVAPAPAPDTNTGNSDNGEIPVSKTTLGSVSGYTYVTPGGLSYLMRRPGLYISGRMSEILQDPRTGEMVSKTTYCCGTMSYTTYGTWTSYKEDKHGVFYTGEATAANAVPTQGSATYTGSGMRDGEISPATFQVDFAAKTINGNIAASEKFGSEIAMQGQIINGGIKGAAQTAGQDGTFIGHFNGPAAQELGGIAQFADAKLDASFGVSAAQ
jgi:hypothetical protein